MPYELEMRWNGLVNNLNEIKKEDKSVTIAICGKYTSLEDSYASIIEALTHCKAHT